ncbi:hypothetical protein NEAUS04_0634 [Nematocida ausubeli]|nr:hypothetical protein NEAUS07_1584 [Nematocida ausubeli]KAI5161644.1 hypothetical protein NEAUS04_0634 [Nematocida ausubeli]
MKFRLIEDAVETDAQEHAESASEENEIDSEEFFQLNTKNDESSEEENMWSDSEEGDENNHWTVEKIEKRPGQVRKTKALTKNILKYTTKHILTIRRGIVKVVTVNERIYLLDRTGHIYLLDQSEEEQKPLQRIEVKKGLKERLFKDFIVCENGNILALTKLFHAFSIINPETGAINEVNLYQYKDKAYSKIIRIESGCVLVSGRSLLVYNHNALLVDRIEMEEKVEDLVEDGEYFMVLLRSKLVRYSRKMKESVAESEVLVGPHALCIFNDSVAVGGKGGLSIFQKSTLEVKKELSNLENVTSVSYIEEMGILVFGDREKSNGIRMYNAKEEKVITTFPPSKGLSYIGGFTCSARSLYFGVKERLYLLSIPN